MGTNLNTSTELIDSLFESGIACDSIVDGLTRMDNRAVVSSPKMQPDCLERRICELFGEIHGNLPRINDLLFSCLCPQEVFGDIKKLANDMLNLINVYRGF